MAASTSFDNFYAELKQTEQKDATLTPKQQIDRLLRPGYTYRNLNPFEVLQVDPEMSLEEIKKKFRRFSILVHPDKNQDDQERAQIAFDAIKRAWTVLEDKATRQACLDLVDEAKGRTKLAMEDKRKKLRKEGKPTNIDEDDPTKFKAAVHVLTMKLFADLERKRQQNENKISEEAAKKREKELADEEKKEMIKTFEKNWEESREGRVTSWMDFKKGSGGGKKKKEKKVKHTPIGFRPPKTKPETR